MEKISVVMPTYNAESYIGEAIESILGQSYSNFELLVVDDNSTDKTKEIIEKYQIIDSRVRYIQGPCKGIAAALNKGLDISDGKYIARMDADDISLPNRFEKQVEKLESDLSINVCGTLAIAFFPDGREELWGNEKNRIENPGIINQLDEVVVCHPTVMFRKKDFEHYNMRYNENFKTAEDQELWSRAIRCLKFYNIQEVLHKYRAHDGNASALKKDDGNNNLLLIKLELLKWLCPNANFLIENVEINAQRIVKNFNSLSDDIDKCIFEDYKKKIYRFEAEPKWKMVVALLLFNKKLLIEKIRTYKIKIRNN